MSEGIGDLKEMVLREIDLIRDRMADMANRIYAVPEVGYCEHKASWLLASFLEEQGFEVQRNTAGMETAFMASALGGMPGPTVALLAEYDALPGLGHGCGHNLIGVAAAGAGAALRKVLPNVAGRVVVAGCPAEEAGCDDAGGKVRMVEDGCFQGVAAALMFHPSPCTTIGGETSALIGLEFVFEGKAAHAAGNPWDGINALDGVLQTFNAINALRQQAREFVRIHGIVTHGGDAPNIIPARAAARFFVRSLDGRSLREVAAKVENCARGAALATGTTLSVNRFCRLYESMKSNAVLAGVLEKNLNALGLCVEGKKKGKGSTDFGNVTRAVPGCELAIRLGDGIVPHTQEFLAAAGSEEGRAVMVAGAKVMALSVIDLLLTPQLLDEARREFEAARG